MKHFFYTCFFLTAFALVVHGQSMARRDIALKLTPYANCNVYLGGYFGNGKVYADTARLDAKSEGHFNGKLKLTDGVYFIISPDNKILFEFLLSDSQHFDIIADTAHGNDIMFTNSPDNTLFKTYVKRATGIIQQRAELNNQYAAAVPAVKMAIKNQQALLGESVGRLKDSVVRIAPKSLAALLLIIGRQPELPAGFAIKTHTDSIRVLQYLKKHYWDDVAFNDDRLLHTPFFDSKIDTYFNNYAGLNVDSVIKDVQYMLLYARTGKEMYPYLLMKFTNRYLNPTHVGEEKVFLYLFENFFMKGDTALLNTASKKMMFNRAYALMANRVGDPAPALDLTNIANGKNELLYAIKGPYTLVVFWDPSCTHCQHDLPRIDSIYRAKWKAMGMRLYSVNIDPKRAKEVTSFAQSKNLSADWIHTYQTDNDAQAVAKMGQFSYLQLYGVAETPSLYLLDADKHIIAKHLTIEQFDALLNLKQTKN